MKDMTDNQFKQLALRVQALRRADIKANLKRIGKAAEIVVTRRRMPNIL